MPSPSDRLLPVLAALPWLPLIWLAAVLVQGDDSPLWFVDSAPRLCLFLSVTAGVILTAALSLFHDQWRIRRQNQELSSPHNIRLNMSYGYTAEEDACFSNRVMRRYPVFCRNNFDLNRCFWHVDHDDKRQLFYTDSLIGSGAAERALERIQPALWLGRRHGNLLEVFHCCLFLSYCCREDVQLLRQLDEANRRGIASLTPTVSLRLEDTSDDILRGAKSYYEPLVLLSDSQAASSGADKGSENGSGEGQAREPGERSRAHVAIHVLFAEDRKWENIDLAEMIVDTAEAGLGEESHEPLHLSTDDIYIFRCSRRALRRWMREQHSRHQQQPIFSFQRLKSQGHPEGELQLETVPSIRIGDVTLDIEVINRVYGEQMALFNDELRFWEECSEKRKIPEPGEEGPTHWRELERARERERDREPEP